MKSRNKRKLQNCAGLLVAVSASLAGACLLYRHYLPPVRHPSNESRHYPVAILLGCPCHDDGSMRTSQIKRCQLAIDRRDLYDRLIITGGAVKNEFVEADAMKGWIEVNAPESIAIQTESVARNTWENLANVRKMAGDVPVLLLTSDLHARRAAAMAGHFFSDVSAAGYPEHRLKHVLREAVSQLVYIRLELKKLLHVK